MLGFKTHPRRYAAVTTNSEISSAHDLGRFHYMRQAGIALSILEAA